MCDGERDGPRPGAQIDDKGCGAGGPGGVDGEAGDDLALGSRHKDAGADLQRQVAEVSTPGQVLQRDAVGPLPHQLSQPIRLCRRQFRPHNQPPTHLRRLDIEHEGGQFDGIGIGCGDTRLRQVRGGGAQGVIQAHRGGLSARRGR